jgi:hypothetical protein
LEKKTYYDVVRIIDHYNDLSGRTCHRIWVGGRVRLSVIDIIKLLVFKRVWTTIDKKWPHGMVYCA